MERARQAGHNLHDIASFSVSRVDTEIDTRLDTTGSPRRATCAARRDLADELDAALTHTAAHQEGRIA